MRTRRRCSLSERLAGACALGRAQSDPRLATLEVRGKERTKARGKYIQQRRLETQGPQLSWHGCSPQSAVATRVTADSWSFPIGHVDHDSPPMHPCAIWRLCASVPCLSARRKEADEIRGLRHSASREDARSRCLSLGPTTGSVYIVVCAWR
ncbi:hypothetical protein B0J12DRAFT_45140 [Macrophomina phaseolina]|uniref:Uncharacterized protein n=1 Tax=Macrophomina phaseolina TaxID=35725 RepID=A0ABQ8GDS4_9PEZI|nr:hypothetical protein B0J12DRAFT_45140 [Macrophomina phaseolina]